MRKPIVLEVTGFNVAPDQERARKALLQVLGKCFSAVEIKFNGAIGAKPTAKTSDVSIYDAHRFVDCVKKALGNTCQVTLTITM